MEPQPEPIALNDTLKLAAWVFDVEIQALARTRSILGSSFSSAIDTILSRIPPGKVIVSGVGKSGLIGRKIAATLSSTGTPSFFMHPGEAGHGDLGMVASTDVVIAISYSGESTELIALLPYFRRHAIPVVTITGNPESTLARNADHALDIRIEQEACPLKLAPTSSTTATLALGDAIAVVLLKRRGFGKQDFAMTHPSGTLGRRLLVRLQDIMLSGSDAPRVGLDTSIRDTLVEMSRGSIGLAAVTHTDGTLCGVFTDGDLRRVLDKNLDIYGTPVHSAMTPEPAALEPQELAATAVALMQKRKSNAVLIVDSGGKYLGAVNWRMLLQSGVV